MIDQDSIAHRTASTVATLRRAECAKCKAPFRGDTTASDIPRAAFAKHRSGPFENGTAVAG